VPSRHKALYVEESAGDDLKLERNLQSLLAPQRTSILDLPIERIHPNPFQARRTFDGIEELAGAIRAQGFITRLRVRQDPEAAGYYQLVYGERRLRAAQVAGLTTVPCELAAYSDGELIEIGLAENIQRRDLNPLEEARALKLFIEQYRYTQQRLADRIGKDINYVNRRLKLLETPIDVQRMVVERPDSLIAALEIARVAAPADRRPLIQQVTSRNMTKREVQAQVKVVLDRTATTDTDITTPSHQRGGGETASELSAQQPPQLTARAGAINVTLDREMRTIRKIIAGWSRDLRLADEEHKRQLADFLRKHIEQTQQLLGDVEPNT
jgi:ParB family chromosome partitioning protein